MLPILVSYLSCIKIAQCQLDFILKGISEKVYNVSVKKLSFSQKVKQNHILQLLFITRTGIETEVYYVRCIYDTSKLLQNSFRTFFMVVTSFQNWFM